jgi:DNA-directed RNA polymerase specialized sigma24 family protein
VLHEQIIQGPFARNLIAKSARYLSRKSEFDDMSIEDLQQELRLRVIRGLCSYDPKRSPMNPFTALIVRRAVGMILRERRAEKRWTCFIRYRASLDDLADPDSAQDFLLLELEHDVENLLKACPAKYRPLAEQLQSETLAEAARTLKVPRSTLQRWVKELRHHFDRQLPSADVSRAS